MNRKLLVLFIPLIHISVSAQQNQTLSLEQLQQLARDNYPLLKQKELYNTITANKVKQLGTRQILRCTVSHPGSMESQVAPENPPPAPAPVEGWRAQ